jgi:hypothetical protein
VLGKPNTSDECECPIGGLGGTYLTKLKSDFELNDPDCCLVSHDVFSYSRVPSGTKQYSRREDGCAYFLGGGIWCTNNRTFTKLILDYIALEAHLIHGNVLSAPLSGAGLVIVGPSGGGKNLLSRLLIRQLGFRMVADDFVIIPKDRPDTALPFVPRTGYLKEEYSENEVTNEPVRIQKVLLKPRCSDGKMVDGGLRGLFIHAPFLAEYLNIPYEEVARGYTESLKTLHRMLDQGQRIGYLNEENLCRDELAKIAQMEAVT